jgi:hypothetical protein
MPKRRVTVYPVPGARSTARAIAYLVFEGDDEVDAWRELRRIDTTTYRSGIDERNKVWARFRHWVSGLTHDEYHHGWPMDPEFLMGYVFRWDHQRQHRRMYGFLVYPRPRFEVCVLCCFRAKAAWRTEPAVKRTVRTLSQHREVFDAVRNAFNTRRKKRWSIH